jgi:DNA-binding transcriptional ArsR family regulator
MPPRSKKSNTPELHEVLAALGDPVRLDIVRQLAARGEVPCSGFNLDLAKSTLSHHFKVLREAGLVGARSEGTSLMNYLDRDAVDRHFPGLLDGVLGAQQKSRRKRAS